MTPFITTQSGVLLILLALTLDLLMGDPVWLYHPVRIIGWGERRLESVLRRLFGVHEFIPGMLLTCFLVGGSYAVAWGICTVAYHFSVIAGSAVEVFILYTTFALRSLTSEGTGIAALLRRDDLVGARRRTAGIVSRDLSHEDAHGVMRATIESLTENLADGVIAPLFFAVLGGAPLALAYKAVNTLDSMIGYHSERYEYFGKFAARLDDVANYIPARITGVLLVVSSLLLHKHPLLAVRAWYADAQKGPSPNGGIPITTFAGAMDMRLGGDCFDHAGTRIPIPYVGGRRIALMVSDICWANRFILLSTLLFVVGIVVLAQLLR